MAGVDNVVSLVRRGNVEDLLPYLAQIQGEANGSARVIAEAGKLLNEEGLLNKVFTDPGDRQRFISVLELAVKSNNAESVIGVFKSAYIEGKGLSAQRLSAMAQGVDAGVPTARIGRAFSSSAADVLGAVATVARSHVSLPMTGRLGANDAAALFQRILYQEGYEKGFIVAVKDTGVSFRVTPPLVRAEGVAPGALHVEYYVPVGTTTMPKLPDIVLDIAHVEQQGFNPMTLETAIKQLDVELQKKTYRLITAARREPIRLPNPGLEALLKQHKGLQEQLAGGKSAFGVVKEDNAVRVIEVRYTPENNLRIVDVIDDKQPITVTPDSIFRFGDKDEVSKNAAIIRAYELPQYAKEGAEISRLTKLFWGGEDYTQRDALFVMNYGRESAGGWQQQVVTFNQFEDKVREFGRTGRLDVAFLRNAAPTQGEARLLADPGLAEALEELGIRAGEMKGEALDKLTYSLHQSPMLRLALDQLDIHPEVQEIVCVFKHSTDGGYNHTYFGQTLSREQFKQFLLERQILSEEARSYTLGSLDYSRSFINGRAEAPAADLDLADPLGGFIEDMAVVFDRGPIPIEDFQRFAQSPFVRKFGLSGQELDQLPPQSARLLNQLLDNVDGVSEEMGWLVSMLNALSHHNPSATVYAVGSKTVKLNRQELRTLITSGRVESRSSRYPVVIKTDEATGVARIDIESSN